MGELTELFNDMTVQAWSRRANSKRNSYSAEKAAVVGRLAAAIAHEIRNPLNYINLTLDHLRSSFAPEDPEKRETFERLADQLKTEVARINAHITEFLKYSRPSTLELRPLDLRVHARDAMRMIEVQAAESGIETRVEQRRRRAARDGRRRIAAVSFHQSGHQQSAGDRWRRRKDWHVTSRPRTKAATRAHRNHRHWTRHRRGRHLESIRAVFFNQGDRHRAGAGDCEEGH